MNILAHITRGGISESRHAGFIAIADAEGRPLYTSGPLEEDRVSFMRSAAKPLQALALLETGAADRYGLTPAELALTCASHNGEPEHTSQVQVMLDKGGLQADGLLCGSHYPYHAPTEQAMRLAGEQPTNLHSNCSGKHTGMLLVCQHMGWPTEDYTEPDHPLQKLILQTMGEFTDLRPAEIATGVDGCSVVCFGLTTLQMATAFARLATPAYWQDRGQAARAAAVQRITSAMWSHPFNVGGSERTDTDLMGVAVKGRIFNKIGAEAVWCVGFPEKGLGLTIKIDDGSSRAKPTILVEALRQTGLLSEAEIAAFEALQVKPIRNVRGKLVGHHTPTFQLRHPDDWQHAG